MQRERFDSGQSGPRICAFNPNVPLPWWHLFTHVMVQEGTFKTKDDLVGTFATTVTLSPY